MYNLKTIDFSLPVDDWLKAQDDNINLMEKYDGIAQAKEQLVDRYVRHPFADGYAYYVITKETSRTVTVKVLKGLGDDWTLPMWGNGCTTSKKVVVEYLNSQDALSKLFGGKR